MTHNSNISLKSNLIPITSYWFYDKRFNNIRCLEKMIQQTEAGTEIINFSWILSKRTKELRL